MVQQDPVVMADTFLANVTLGRDVSEAQVWQALKRYNWQTRRAA